MRDRRAHILRIYHAVTLGAYAVALATCFICNLAVNRTLTWFPVVLASSLLAFSVTNLPLLVRRERLTMSAAGVTMSLCLLLYVTGRLVGAGWFRRYAAPIAAFPVVLLWLAVLALRARRVVRPMKAAVLLGIAGVLIACMNPWVDFVMAGEMPALKSFWDFEVDIVGRAGGYDLYFALGFVLVAAGAVVALAVGARKK